MKLNPFTRELIQNALAGISDNMIVSVMRTSRSTIVKNNLDFSSSICDSHGRQTAQGLALPGHLGSTMPALKGCLDYFGDDIHPGDMLASNDPYAGASHLNDIFMFKPFYAANGKRLGFLSLILHHTDMGGRVPGGQATDSTEIFQEGLRIPPSKICEAGVINQTLYRLIETNVRVPNQVLADLRAQISALDSGEREVQKLLAEFDADEFAAYMTDMIDYSERLTRAGIAALPDGEAEFTEWIDDYGVEGTEPVRIQVKLTIAGDCIDVDFAGSSPQKTGALNLNYAFTASCTYAAVRTALDPRIPNNAGFYRPITVRAPEGSFVNIRFPAALGARGQGGYRIRTVVLGALAQLLPERMTACPGGSDFCVVFAGKDDREQDFLFVESHIVTGHGASAVQDGQEGGAYCLGNVANVPVEVLESENPVRIEEYGFLPDTGGPGRHRGALGVVRQYRLLADRATVQLRSDRQTVQPWGLFGGKASTPPAILRNPGPTQKVLPSKFVSSLERNDVLRAELAGAGGYGDPLERDPAAVLDDVRQGKLTVGHALDAYGVVIDGDGLDTAATETERANAPRGTT
ncbi:MAG: hydantoinase B/oxoprolinase family protein [Rhodospirillales bacterium]|jgi:N-methylhydantoinase B|nr:hydantoinase B/oxoprolinase family protein [Rhodospirillales bacterium]